MIQKNDNDEYKRGYREGFLDGFHAARDNDSLMSPNIPNNDWTKPHTIMPWKCNVCGLTFQSLIDYVCPRGNCPTKAFF